MNKSQMMRLLYLWHSVSKLDADSFEEMLELRDKLVTSILG